MFPVTATPSSCCWDVEVEPRPPELAFRDAAHAEALDPAYRLGDGGILDLPQLGPP